LENKPVYNNFHNVSKSNRAPYLQQPQYTNSINYFSIGTGTFGYHIGKHMSSVSRFAPLYWNNGTIYRPGLSGFRYGIIPGNIAVKLGTGLRFAGGVLGTLGLVNSSIHFYNEPSLKGAIDIGFGIASFAGPVGLGIYSIYVVGDTFIPGGWEATPELMYQQIRDNSVDGIWMNPYIHFK
jgi:hypothetical protein